jgi:hypothetical protein
LVMINQIFSDQSGSKMTFQFSGPLVCVGKALIGYILPRRDSKRSLAQSAKPLMPPRKMIAFGFVQIIDFPAEMYDRIVVEPLVQQIRRPPFPSTDISVQIRRPLPNEARYDDLLREYSRVLRFAPSFVWNPLKAAL